MTSPGSVSIDTSPPSVVIKTMKAKQAHIMSVMQPRSVKSINGIKLTLHNTFYIPKVNYTINITGCIVSPNGKMIFADCYCNRLVFLNDDGTLDKEIPCSLRYPFDVTYLDDRTAAGSTDNGIEIINIDTEKPERRINTSQWCYGIAYHNGVLLWCEVERSIHMMKLSEDRITTLVKQIKPSYSYVTTCREKIYQTNPNTNTSHATRQKGTRCGNIETNRC